MRLHKLLFSLLCVFSCLSLVFSSISLNASAVSDTYTTIPEIFFRENLPTISGQYVASDLSYKPITFTFQEAQTFSTSVLDSPENLYGRKFYAYKATTPSDLYVAGTGPYITVDINLQFSNVGYINTGFVSWAGTLSQNRVLNYDMASLRPNFFTYYYFDGASSTQYLQARPDNSAVPGHIPLQGDSAIYCGWNNTFESSSGGTFNFGSSSFCTFWTANGIWIGIIAPRVNDDYVYEGVSAPPVNPPDDDDDDISGDSSGVASGTISDNGDGTQNINVTVETDNSGLIGGIIQGIKNLFVPSDEALSDFTQDVKDEFVDHLGGVSEVIDLLDEQGDYLRNAVATDTIYVGQIRAPVGDGEYFELGGWDVELKPEYEQLHLLYDSLPFVIDLIAVFAVMNMLRTKFDILLNPEGECITYDS